MRFPRILIDDTGKGVSLQGRTTWGMWRTGEMNFSPIVCDVEGSLSTACVLGVHQFVQVTYSFGESRYLGLADPYGITMVASDKVSGSMVRTFWSNQFRKTSNSFT